MDELKAVRDNQGVIHAPNALLTDASGERNVGTGSDIFSMVFDRGIFVDKSMLVKDVLTGSQAVLPPAPLWQDPGRHHAAGLL